MATWAETFVGARVYNSGAETITTSTNTQLSFDSERYDTDTIHSTSTGTNSRLTATTAGKYLIVGCVQWEANGTGTRIVSIYLNGATFIGRVRVDPGNVVIVQEVVTIYDLAATDYVELNVYQVSGGDLNVDAVANHSPEFMMSRIG